MMTLVKRKFIPGEEWIYYKVYLGTLTSDIVLTDLFPIIDQLIKKKIILKWFYLRYHDPIGHHLRIRFKLISIESFPSVLSKVNTILIPLIRERFVHNISLGTYNREIERYGQYAIDDTETIFFYDSQMILKAIGEIKDKTMFTLFIVKSLNAILDTFRLNIDSKISLIQESYYAFREEFKADKYTIKQFSKKYQELSDFRKSIEVYNENLILERQDGISPYINSLIFSIEKSSVDLNSYIQSILHMSINRAFNKNQRINEFICYYFLYQYLKELKFRQL
ncbi:hypothetical protein HX109_04975 [Galbibacter sp. BG1]|uniref:thiopeptide-type bacteriocin biosynthesis protein n=1 Tax=Galbibacter sp. BG1 TaxID=1170699 RepID=UPI0015C1C01E|nr:thiopeptide-type bacteriocin biosynthesis protein [Galbibacter sp. BG1]QLE00948.1 hypothetical protein HX109_04975 [Galbibacter sp. BG1]